MKTRRRLGSLFAVLALASTSEASAEPQGNRHILTLERARELARQRAPRVRVARERVGIARGALEGAEVFQPFNPTLSLGAGPRFDAGETTVDAEGGLGQRFEIGGQRGARIERAEAGISRSRWEAEDAERRAVLEVSVAHARALHAGAAIEVAREGETLARDLRRVAEERHQVGDVGVLDVRVAQMTFARSRSAVRRLEARRARALGRLRALLGLSADAEVVVRGDLEDRQRYQLDALLGEVSERPDLRAFDAELRAARAEEQLGEAERWPDLGVFVRGGREEGAGVVRGGIQIHFPLFERGQELRATGAARRKAVSVERDASRQMVRTQVRNAHEVYATLDRAAREFADEALPRLEQSLDLARQSYQAGNIAVGELLVLQREMVQARMAYVDLLLDAALAGIELEAAAGTL